MTTGIASLQKATAAGIASLLLMASTFPSQAAQVTDFQDVKLTAWYYQAVDYATREGLFAGTSATTFSPELGMTRAMFVTALGRMAGQTGKSGMASCFTDVDPDAWYGPSVEWAAGQQIVSGVGNNRFAPDEPIPREQLAVMLMKYVSSIHGGTSFGPIGIVITHSMLGVNTPKMALEVAQSSARRILILFSHYDTVIAGTETVRTTERIHKAVTDVQKLCGST